MLIGTFTRSERSEPAASVIETDGPPYGQPLPSVRSMRSPSSRDLSAVK